MFDSVWYDSLTKPFLKPPAWIFTPVWIILYGIILISIIIYTVTHSKKNKINGYIYLILHMIFNLLWSPVFFALHRIDIALLVIVLMCITLIFMIYKFYSISKLAGALLIPYLCWIIFALYLNIQFLILN